MHLLNKSKITISFLLIFLSIQSFAYELEPPKEILKDKILMHYFSKVKQSYDNLNYQAERCFRQEDNNTITMFNYTDPSIKDIDIFNFVHYVYYKNQDTCLHTSTKQLSYDMAILKSLFNDYMVKDTTLMPHLFAFIGSPTLQELKFNTENSYKKLPIQAKEYLDKTLGKKPFNIKPFREIYTKKLEQERELRLKK
jgi:hypothetical protein